jgi:hypothetical protein
MEVITLKKLLTLLFTFALAFSLAMPVFAQEAGGTTETPKKEKKMKKEKPAKKEKKSKKEKKADTTGGTQ